MKKQSRWEIFFVIVALISTFYIVTSSDFFGKKLSVQVGQIATETIYAPFQIENVVATERKRMQAALGVSPVYKTNELIYQTGSRNITNLFDYTLTVKTSQVANQFNVTPIALLQSKSPIPLYEDEYRTLLGLSEAKLQMMEETCLAILEQLLDEGIKEDENKFLEVKTRLEATVFSAVEQKLAYEIITSEIKPNIIVDEEATEQAKQKVSEDVEPSYVLQGEIIVAQGTRITEEMYQLIDQAGFLEDDNHTNYMQYMGLAAFILIMLIFLAQIFKSYNAQDEFKFKQRSLLFILYMLSLIIIRFFVTSNFVYMPLSIAAMLISILIKRDLAVIMHIVLVILSALLCKGDIIFIVYMLLTGIMSVLAIAQMQQRKQTMKCAALVGILRFVVYVSLNLLVGIEMTSVVWLNAAQAFVIGVIEVVLVVGSLPLWEAAFGFVTPIQLLELTNPNQPVLKRLLIEATGTYYHSLLVANLAEAAASEIGANTLLARVGGYYHDIGKLSSSNYFKENQVVENPHDYMDPATSSQIILSHVSVGVELADAYRLPKYVKDMIRQHHGTGVMRYFYVKAQEHTDKEVNIKEFQYPGPKPQTKEAALVMLADVVEATVRAMQPKIGVELTVEQIVRKMVKEKLDEGQLDECPLYISDIEKVIGSFTHMLKGMYHERIEYPEKKG